MDDEVASDVTFLPTPCDDVVSMCCINNKLLFGSSQGELISSLCISSTQGKLVLLPPQEPRLLVPSARVPLDVLCPTPDGAIVACFWSGNKIAFVGWFGEMFRFVAEASLGEARYTNRASAHCWCGLLSLAVGCVDGSICIITLSSSAKGPTAFCSQLCRETAGVIQMVWDEEPQQLIVSTTTRSVIVKLSTSEPTVAQIGVKPRISGQYGACFSPVTHRVYAARPNRRVFEANHENGNVFKTFKFPECDNELAILRYVRHTTDEELLLTESPTFVALLSLASSGFRGAVAVEDCAIICGAPLLNFFVFLCSNDHLMTMIVGPPVPTLPTKHRDLSFLVETEDPAPATKLLPLQVENTEMERDFVGTDGAVKVKAVRRSVKGKRSSGEEARAGTTTSTVTTGVGGRKIIRTVRRIRVTNAGDVLEKETLPSPSAGDRTKDDDTEEAHPSVSSSLQDKADVAPDAREELEHLESKHQPEKAERVIEESNQENDVEPSFHEEEDSEKNPENFNDLEHYEGNRNVPEPETVLEPLPVFPPALAPSPLELFIDETNRVFATHAACGLDRSSQPRVLAEILQWVEKLRLQLSARTTGGRDVLSSEIMCKACTLLVAGLEWIVFVPLLTNDTGRETKAELLFDMFQLLEWPCSEDRCQYYEKICRALSASEDFHNLMRKVAFCCVALSQATCFPQLGTSRTNSWTVEGDASFSALDEKIIGSDPSIVEDLTFHTYSTCCLQYYFPFLFAVLPSKALHTVLSCYPTISVRHLQWSLSHHIQTQVIRILDECRCSVILMEREDLADSLCDFVMLIAQEFKDKISSDMCFARCVEILLERRYQLKEQLVREASESSPSASPVEVRQVSFRALGKRKIRRLEDTLMDLLQSCKLKMNIAFPKLREVFDRFSYPEGIVELRAIEASIEDHATSGRIDQLMPLFKLDVINESHWIALFEHAHKAHHLEAAMIMCLALVQQPKNVRYLLRKAFPFIDSPDLDDEELRHAVEKLSALIVL